MTVAELLDKFSWEVMVRIKEAGSFAKIHENPHDFSETSEHDLTLFHDFNKSVDRAYDDMEVVDWFYAKYEGECDELVVWIKEV